MLVHGDVQSQETAGTKLARIAALLDQALAAPPGLERHGLLIAGLIEAGELAQGVADAAFRAAGERDAASPAARAAMDLAAALAALCSRSWESDFQATGARPTAEVRACAEAIDPAARLEITRPEGYAFYALYPESYLEAARRCPRGAWRVVGVRSIGTSLAAMVAAGLEAAPPVTVRPTGHPFDRQVCAAAPVEASADALHAIVDEGPGLSGSSLAAVARWLESSGVPGARQHFFAGHGRGPGREAHAEIRARWATTPVHVGDFDTCILRAGRPAHRLDSWVAGLVGPLTGPLRDLGGGAWRTLQRRAAGAAWPPAHPWQERRKFLAESASGRWLVKFAGLGRTGHDRLARARQLAAAGFSAAPAGLCHGFLVERWLEDAVPLAVDAEAALGEPALERIGDYLAFRARSFAAPVASGASLQRLHAMGRHNSVEAFGAAAAATWDAWMPSLADLEVRSVRVEIDGRLQRWEWLLVDGHLFKTDALDHHAGHDLVGCQDIAWDIAGAAVEFGLDAAAEKRLASRVARQSGWRDHAPLRRFLRLCYLAFQLGSWRMAAEASPEPTETERLRAQAGRYEHGLQAALAAEPPAT